MNRSTKLTILLVLLALLIAFAAYWLWPKDAVELSQMPESKPEADRYRVDVSGQAVGDEEDERGSVEEAELFVPGNGMTAKEKIEEYRKEQGVPEEDAAAVDIPGNTLVRFVLGGNNRIKCEFRSQEGLFNVFPLFNNQKGNDASGLSSNFKYGDDEDSFWFAESHPSPVSPFTSTAPLTPSDFYVELDDYFVVSDCDVAANDNTCFSYVLRFDELDAENYVLTFTDMATGVVEVVIDRNTNIAELARGGKIYVVGVEQDATGKLLPRLAVDHNGDGSLGICDAAIIGIQGEGLLLLGNQANIGGVSVPATVACGSVQDTSATVSIQTLAKEFDEAAADEIITVDVVPQGNTLTVPPPRIAASSGTLQGFFQLEENEDIEQAISGYGVFFETYRVGSNEPTDLYDLYELTAVYPLAQTSARVFVGNPSVDVSVEPQPPEVEGVREPSAVPGRLSTSQIFEQALGMPNSDIVEIGSTSDLLEINEPIGDVREGLTEVDLDMLKGGQIVTDEGSTEFNQYLLFPTDSENFPTSGSVQFDEDERDRVNHFLFWDTGSVLFEWKLDFEEGLESNIEPDGSLDDFEDEDLSILGQPFVVPEAKVFEREIVYANNEQDVEILFLGGSVSGILGENDKQTYTTLDGKTYDVEVVVISETDPQRIVGSDGDVTVRRGKVKFRINGEITPELEEGETTVLADGSQIGIRSIMPTGKNIQKSTVQFYLGAYNIRIRDSNAADDQFERGQVRVNQEDVESALVRIQGQKLDDDTFEIRDITYRLEANAVMGDIFVPAGHGLREQLQEPEAMLTPNWDVFYAGLSGVGVENPVTT